MEQVLNAVMDLVVPPASMPSPSGVTSQSQPANTAQGGGGGQGAFLPSANDHMVKIKREGWNGQFTCQIQG